MAKPPRASPLRVRKRRRDMLRAISMAASSSGSLGCWSVMAYSGVGDAQGERGGTRVGREAARHGQSEASPDTAARSAASAGGRTTEVAGSQVDHTASPGMGSRSVPPEGRWATSSAPVGEGHRVAHHRALEHEVADGAGQRGPAVAQVGGAQRDALGAHHQGGGRAGAQLVVLAARGELGARHGDDGAGGVARVERARPEVGRADEAGHEDRRRVVVDLLGGADLLDLAAVHHRDPVAHRERLFLVVGDEDEGDADLALDALELELHRLAELEVEGAERLVEQQGPGEVHQRPGEGDALLLATGELGRAALGEVAQPHHAEELVDPARRSRPWGPSWRGARRPRCPTRSCAGTARTAGRRCSRCACAAAPATRPRPRGGSHPTSASRSRRSCGASWSCRSPTGRASRRTRPHRSRSARRRRRRSRRTSWSRGRSR